MLQRPVPRSPASLVLAILVHAALGGILWGVMLAGDPPPEPPPPFDIPLPPLQGPREPARPGGGLREQGPRRPDRAPQPSPETPPPMSVPDDPVSPTDSDDALAEDSSMPPTSLGEGSPWGDGGDLGPGGPGGSGHDLLGEGGGAGPDDGIGEGATPSSEPMIIRTGMVPPRILLRVEPEPPAIARGRVKGTVVLRCVIDAEGRVSVREVLQGVPLFTKSAVDAVEKWRYEPALWDGRPQAVFQTVKVVFR